MHCWAFMYLLTSEEPTPKLSLFQKTAVTMGLNQGTKHFSILFSIPLHFLFWKTKGGSFPPWGGMGESTHTTCRLPVPTCSWEQGSQKLNLWIGIHVPMRKNNLGDRYGLMIFRSVRKDALQNKLPPANHLCNRKAIWHRKWRKGN